MAYKRVTGEEHRLIYRWRQEGESVREMGRRLGRAASSISREVLRNMGGRGYRPKQAHEKAHVRAMRPGHRRFTEEVRPRCGVAPQRGVDPEIISERARLEGRPSVCKETIYKHIYADAKEGGKATEVTLDICGLFARMHPASRRSLTFDNDKEFAHHEEIARATGMDVFFARPYHSWERGTNENTNGLIRRHHPTTELCPDTPVLLAIPPSTRHDPPFNSNTKATPASQ